MNCEQLESALFMVSRGDDVCIIVPCRDFIDIQAQTKYPAGPQTAAVAAFPLCNQPFVAFPFNKEAW